MTSRWSSAFADPQWIMVAMDSLYTIGGVTLEWENAYGRQYQIQVSTDSLAWQTVYTETKGNGGRDNLSFAPVQARYVRLNGTKRASSYGYSLFEFKIYRGSTTGILESEGHPERFGLEPNYPNPFNPETMIRYHLPVVGDVELTVCSAVGSTVRTLVNSTERAGAHAVRWDGRDDYGRPLPSGVYLCRLKTLEAAASRKMLMLK
jgi:hypothetical protein